MKVIKNKINIIVNNNYFYDKIIMLIFTLRGVYRHACACDGKIANNCNLFNVS